MLGFIEYPTHCPCLMLTWQDCLYKLFTVHPELHVLTDYLCAWIILIDFFLFLLPSCWVTKSFLRELPLILSTHVMQRGKSQQYFKCQVQKYSPQKLLLKLSRTAWNFFDSSQRNLIATEEKFLCCMEKDLWMRSSPSRCIRLAKARSRMNVNQNIFLLREQRVVHTFDSQGALWNINGVALLAERR